MKSYVSLISRIVASVAGGYMLAALFSVTMLALPLTPAESALCGLQLSFLVYGGAVVWSFIAKSALQAWLGLLGAAWVLLFPALYILRGGIA